ncbi:MAG: hypothetical protein WAM11_05225 [Cyanobium sp.]
MTEIARDTRITTQTLYNWRSQWQKQDLLVPATARPAEQGSSADKLAAVIETAGLNGSDLRSFCRERGLYPKQVARWRQAAEDANGPTLRAWLISATCGGHIADELSGRIRVRGVSGEGRKPSRL